MTHTSNRKSSIPWTQSKPGKVGLARQHVVFSHRREILEVIDRDEWEMACMSCTISYLDLFRFRKRHQAWTTEKENAKRVYTNMSGKWHACPMLTARYLKTRKGRPHSETHLLFTEKGNTINNRWRWVGNGMRAVWYFDFIPWAKQRAYQDFRTWFRRC